MGSHYCVCIRTRRVHFLWIIHGSPVKGRLNWDVVVLSRVLGGSRALGQKFFVVPNSCNIVHSRSMCSMVRVWPQYWQAVGGPRDRIWDFVALVWPIRNRVITTSSGLVTCRNLLDGPSVCVRRYICLPCIDTSHLSWTSRWMQEFTRGFKSAKWTVASGS